MLRSSNPTFVPEALIVFMLKHSSAFEWLCINCRCDADPQGGICSTPGGKWQQAQGETGLDIVNVGRLWNPGNALGKRGGALDQSRDFRWLTLDHSGSFNYRSKLGRHLELG